MSKREFIMESKKNSRLRWMLGVLCMLYAGSMFADEVVIDGEGNVYINGEMLIEPYVTDKGLGNCDLEFPYKVPGTGYFVMGDRRSNSVDSRNSVVGAISRDDIIGKVFVRVWPLSKMGFAF